MQTAYDENLTKRLMDLISEGYAKTEELPLHEIQDLLMNPLVDQNIKLYNTTHQISLPLINEMACN